MVVRGPAYIWKKASSNGAVRSFADAFEKVKEDLSAAGTATAAASVAAAHLEMLEDPMLKEAVEAGLAAGKSGPEAIDDACSSICAMFSSIDDEYLRSRVDDVRDIFGRLREAMCGDEDVRTIPPGSVIVAEELLPSAAAKIDFGRVAGILCHRGSATSHVCIIAHSVGVPIRVGVDISGISDGDLVEVDDPLAGGPEAVAVRLRAAGRKVYVNAGSLEDVRAAMAAGADGIGLFRTEFLFMGRGSMPSREEQRDIYLEAMEVCGGRPFTLRLLDIGGDKSLPYLPLPAEDNPFLGVRGVRLGLAHPELYRAQLEAVASAASALRERHPGWFGQGSPVRVMIPMVSSVEEIRRVREMLAAIAGEDAPVSVGIMVETPASVLDASALAAECDFFSVGTNDLTQYVMAADRGNAAVADLYDPLSPAVRRAVELAVAAAHAAGIPAGICGELASDPRATAFLLAAGLDSFSLSHL